MHLQRLKADLLFLRTEKKNPSGISETMSSEKNDRDGTEAPENPQKFVLSSNFSTPLPDNSATITEEAAESSSVSGSPDVPFNFSPSPPKAPLAKEAPKPVLAAKEKE